jgi:hypothetical protein
MHGIRAATSWHCERDSEDPLAMRCPRTEGRSHPTHPRQAHIPMAYVSGNPESPRVDVSTRRYTSQHRHGAAAVLCKNGAWLAPTGGCRSPPNATGGLPTHPRHPRQRAHAPAGRERMALVIQGMSSRAEPSRMPVSQRHRQRHPVTKESLRHQEP